MAITVGIFGISGTGKTSSLFVDEKGVPPSKDFTLEQLEAHGINPEDSVFINADMKALPIRRGSTSKWVKDKNYFETSNTDEILSLIQDIGKGTKMKRVFIDTVNAMMIDREMVESKNKLTFDKWADLAKNVYEIIYTANSLRPDLIIYFMGHVTLYTDVDGNESKCLVTNGRKLEKIKLESKLPIVLFTSVERDGNGNNKYYFETQSNRSTAKTPMGMFDDFKIPNSLLLVDKTIRAYYGI